MSINLHLYATLEATSKLGKHTITDKFGLVQTPTVITTSILKSDNIKKAYIEYIKQREEVELIPEYAEDDIFGEREPIGYTELNYIKDHIESLEAWLKDHEGWDIEWFGM